MKTQPQSAARVVRLNATELDGPGWLARSGGRGLVRSGSGRTAMQGVAEIGPRPAQPEAEPEREVSTFWWVVFAWMEGFALYGAALHPTAAMPVHAILAARRALEPQPEEPLQDSASAESNGNVVKLDRVRPIEAKPERHWKWLRSARARVAAWPAQLRREREVRRAVAALRELDDRTLRDLGICGRAEIEWTVRYCHDC
jgi:uncharacterized protein YjiS (DUF1127 family)